MVAGGERFAVAIRCGRLTKADQRDGQLAPEVLRAAEDDVRAVLKLLNTPRTPCSEAHLHFLGT